MSSSVNVFLGYKIVNGEVVGMIKDVMLAGNAHDAFRDITAISKEREWVSGPFYGFTGLWLYPPGWQAQRHSEVTRGFSGWRRSSVATHAVLYKQR